MLIINSDRKNESDDIDEGIRRDESSSKDTEGGYLGKDNKKRFRTGGYEVEVIEERLTWSGGCTVAMDTEWKLYCGDGHGVEAVLWRWTRTGGCTLAMDTEWRLYSGDGHGVEAVQWRWTRSGCCTVAVDTEWRLYSGGGHGV